MEQTIRQQLEAKYGVSQTPSSSTNTMTVRQQLEAKYGTTPVKVPEKTFGEKISGGIQKIFPGQKVGQAIGTLGAYVAAPKDQRQFVDTSAPTPLQVAGDVAQGALAIGTAGGVRLGAKGASTIGKLAGVGTKPLNAITIDTAKTFGKRALQNTAIGAGFGATGGIKEGKEFEDIAKDTAIGAGAGLGLGIAAEGVVGAVNLATKSGRNRIANKSISEGVDDLLTKTKGIQNKVDFVTKRKNVNLKEILSTPDVYTGIKVVKGKVDPTDAVNTLQARTELLLEGKRAILSELDDKVLPISKAQIRQKAINAIDQTNRLPAEREQIIAEIDRQLSKIPDNLKLSEADMFRAAARSEARNAQGLQKRNSEFTALENAFRDVVFEATDNLPFDTNGTYAALNKYIKDLIETQEFLNKTIKGQTVKGGRLGKYTGRIVGAIAGAKGGPLSSLAGSELGGYISDILINNQFGNNLKLRLISEVVDDPAILKQVQQILNSAIEYNPLKTTALPAPAIRMPARRSPDSDKIYVIPATKNPVSINPKTGKFQTTYSSTPNISLQNTANNIINKVDNTSIKNILPPSKSFSNPPVGKTGLSLKDNRGFIATGYKGESDLTTKILKDLEGKTTVSKQYILDATNRGDLKQVERDLIRDILERETPKIEGVSDELIQEAKKYKSAEEFVNKLSIINDKSKTPGGSLGTSKILKRVNGVNGESFIDDEFTVIRGGKPNGNFYTESRAYAKDFQETYGGDITYARVKPGKSLVVDSSTDAYEIMTGKTPSESIIMSGREEIATINLAKKKGYDSMIWKTGGAGDGPGTPPQIIMLNQKNIQRLSKSQLEEIWKQAHSEKGKIGESPLLVGAGVGLAGVTAAGTIKARLPKRNK